jgi:hypothetical protein
MFLGAKVDKNPTTFHYFPSFLSYNFLFILKFYSFAMLIADTSFEVLGWWADILLGKDVYYVFVFGYSKLRNF